MVGSVGGQGRLGLAALAPAGPPAWVVEARAGEEIALTQPVFAYDLHLHANHRWLRTPWNTQSTHTCTNTHNCTHIYADTHMHVFLHSRTCTH